MSLGNPHLCAADFAHSKGAATASTNLLGKTIQAQPFGDANGEPVVAKHENPQMPELLPQNH